MTSPFNRIALAPADPPGGGDASGGPRVQRPLVPGIPSRRVDPNGVVTQQTRHQRPNQQQAAAHTVAEEGELVVGQGITVKGGIRNCRRLVVHGTVQATVPAQELDVGPDGVVEGRIEVAEATVAGRFDGDLIVDGALTVAPGGLVKGRVRYRTLTVESGGHVSAEIDHIDNADLPEADAPAREAPEVAQQAPAETADAARPLAQRVRERARGSGAADSPAGRRERGRRAGPGRRPGHRPRATRPACRPPSTAWRA
ncbi:MAG: polymer-forming cytoskeletal protein [Rhodovibrio sp.]|nr:polymer-forming cytoskeletal protein [Rhodovibrio sp.]